MVTVGRGLTRIIILKVFLIYHEPYVHLYPDVAELEYIHEYEDSHKYHAFYHVEQKQRHIYALA